MSAVLENPDDLHPERAVQLHQARRAVELNPGLTSAQLVDITGADRDTLLDRLRELQREGLVHTAELTICRFTGRPASVWRPGRDPLLAPREPEAPPELLAGYARAMNDLQPPLDPTSTADAEGHSCSD